MAHLAENVGIPYTVAEYKGYNGKFETDMDGNGYFGTITGISDLVTIHADTVDDIQKEFEEAVDDYLELCAELGDEPNKPA